MREERRFVLKALTTFWAVGLGWVSSPLQAGFMDDTISVMIRVQDESGKPIPFVTVWNAIEYDRQHVSDNGFYQSLQISDLWRVTERYGALHDVIARYGDKPVNTIRIPVLADAEGIFREPLDYQEATGKGNHYARPDSMRFGYTFMKRGYFPGKVDFTLSKNENRVEATVTLKRNPDESLETEPYMQAFARLRYELSDTRKNTSMTPDNQQRMMGLQERMEETAQQALAAGDKQAAARIYSRMRYMPSLNIIDGRIAGWNQGDANSEQAKRALDKAYELDPDNLYVWMQTYLRRMKLPPNPTREQRAAAALQEVEKLIAAKGNAVWPRYFENRAGGYALLGDYTKAYRLYLEAAQREPKYMDWSKAIEKLKKEMQGKGVAIPEN